VLRSASGEIGPFRRQREKGSGTWCVIQPGVKGGWTGGKLKKCTGTLNVILAASLSVAALCPDPGLRQATIGGDRIIGGVILRKRALRFAQVRLSSSDGKLAWIGQTDKNGKFATAKVPPDKYLLKVRGWGSGTVQVDPEIDKQLRQVPAWYVLLFDNGCVATTQIMN